MEVEPIRRLLSGDNIEVVEISVADIDVRKSDRCMWHPNDDIAALVEYERVRRILSGHHIVKNLDSYREPGQLAPCLASSNDCWVY
jgi:hypothetical protein